MNSAPKIVLSDPERLKLEALARSRTTAVRLARTFKVSNDPHFAEKVVDVVGLYTNPPQNAVVLCVDEKSQI